MNFEEIYNKHYRKLFGYAYQYTFSKEDSQDFVHETFSRLWQEYLKGKEIQNVQAWLYKVLLNLIRTSKNRDLIMTSKLKHFETGYVNIEDSQSEYFLNEKKRIISEELNYLENEEKDILILYNKDLRYEEIAQILDMKVSSVGTTLTRAINKFRNNLKTKYNGLFE